MYVCMWVCVYISNRPPWHRLTEEKKTRRMRARDSPGLSRSRGTGTSVFPSCFTVHTCAPWGCNEGRQALAYLEAGFFFFFFFLFRDREGECGMREGGGGTNHHVRQLNSEQTNLARFFFHFLLDFLLGHVCVCVCCLLPLVKLIVLPVLVFFFLPS